MDSEHGRGKVGGGCLIRIMHDRMDNLSKSNTSIQQCVDTTSDPHWSWGIERVKLYKERSCRNSTFFATNYLHTASIEILGLFYGVAIFSHKYNTR